MMTGRTHFLLFMPKLYRRHLLQDLARKLLPICHHSALISHAVQHSSINQSMLHPLTI
jgi:hypothetical protein